MIQFRPVTAAAHEWCRHGMSRGKRSSFTVTVPCLINGGTCSLQMTLMARLSHFVRLHMTHGTISLSLPLSLSLSLCLSLCLSLSLSLSLTHTHTHAHTYVTQFPAVRRRVNKRFWLKEVVFQRRIIPVCHRVYVSPSVAVCSRVYASLYCTIRV